VRPAAYLLATLPFTFMFGLGCSSGHTATEPTTEPTPDSVVEPTDAVHQVVATICTTGVEAVATGVAVADDLLVTVAHTFDDAGGARIVIDGRREPIDVVLLDGQRDIAVLQLLGDPASGDFGPTEQFDTWLGFEAVDDGQDATIITAATGPATTKPAVIVRQIDVTLDGVGQRAGIELETDLAPGDSGSPVVGDGGGIVGIVFASDNAEPRGWAVSAIEIEAALTRTGGPISLDC